MTQIRLSQWAAAHSSFRYSCDDRTYRKGCLQALEGQLEDGQTTVGTKLDVAHVAATPVGMNVTAEAVLTEIDNRRLVFEVVARDEKDIIGKGIHERFIVNAEKFTAKTYGKV